MNAIDWVNQKYHDKSNHPAFKAGDTVKVHVKIKEGEKERVQVYQGVVIAIHKKGPSSTFTVRKVSYGVGVERIFPMTSPNIDKIEVVTVGRVRRAKLYYLRQLSGKKARIRSVDQFTNLKKTVDNTAQQEATVQEAVAAQEAKEAEAKKAADQAKETDGKSE